MWTLNTTQRYYLVRWRRKTNWTKRNEKRKRNINGVSPPPRERSDRHNKTNKQVIQLTEEDRERKKGQATEVQCKSSRGNRSAACWGNSSTERFYQLWIVCLTHFYLVYRFLPTLVNRGFPTPVAPPSSFPWSLPIQRRSADNSEPC